MQYMGGKTRIAKTIVDNHLITHPDRHTYVEPFLGGGSVLARVTASGKFTRHVVADANTDLMDMYTAYQAGWRPPTDVSEDMYQELRTSPASPDRTFVGFACSYGGKWFGGYARNSRGDNFARQGANSLEKQASAGMFGDAVEFRGCPLDALDLSDVDPADAVVYCDPPYSGTTGYDATGAYDPTQGWDTFRAMADAGAVVYVSEYSGPDGLNYVSMRPQASLSLTDKTGRAEERLYTL